MKPSDTVLAPPHAPRPRVIAFGDFRFDAERQTLHRGEAEIALTPKARELLVLFLKHPGRVLTREELQERLWPDVLVTDNALSFQVAEVRRALGDAGAFLFTVPRTGYRWDGEACLVDLDEGGSGGPEADATRAAAGAVIGAARGRPSPPSDRRRRRVPLSVLLALSVGLAVFVALLLLRRPAVSPSAEPPPAAPEPIRLAVLPLAVIGRAGADTGIGLADSLGIRLSLLPGVAVKSTSAVLEAQKKGPADPAELGRRLGVEAVVDGSVRGEAESFEVRVRLLETKSGRTLWAGEARVAAGDRLAVEERLGLELGRALNAPLESLAIERWSAPASADAAELYWRAQALSLRGWRASREAQRLLAEALKRDPRFAAARTLRAQCLGLEVGYGVAEDPERNHREALAEAKEAVRLEPENPYARSVLGGAMADTGDLDGGAAEAAKARDAAPSRPSIHMLLGWLYRWAGLLDKAESAYGTAFAVDASLWRAGVHLAYVKTLKGEHAAAEDALARLRRFGATADTAASEMEAWRLYNLRKWSEAEAVCRVLAGREGVLNYCERLTALAAVRRGETGPARAFVGKPGEDRYPDGRRRFDRSAVFAALGDGDRAIAELLAAEKYGFQAPQALAFDPDLATLSADPRLGEIRKRWEERRARRAATWR